MKIAINGINGRMGNVVLNLAHRMGIEVIGGADPGGENPGVPHFSHNIGDLGAKPDVVIDFSTPEGTVEAVDFCTSNSIPLVSGTTGLTEAQQNKLQTASEYIPLLWSANMSLGINLIMGIISSLPNLLDWDVEISEIHHKFKKDAPSGTALLLARALLEKIPKGKIIKGRVNPREQGELGIVALRGGSIPGEHTIHLLGESEEIRITHRAYSREIFARGALKCAEWIVDKKPGLYTITDVLKGG